MLDSLETVTFAVLEMTIGASMRSGLLRSFAALAIALIAIPNVIAACTAPKTLQEKAQLHPDADTYTEIGNWFGDHKQYDCALDSFQKALKIEPGSAKLFYLVGLTLYAAGRPDQSVEPLKKSIYLMPEVLKPHLLLASALEMLRQPDEARAEWSAALRIDQKSVDAFDGLAKSLMAVNDNMGAVELLQHAPPNETLTLDLAAAYGKARMLDKAAEVLNQALKKNPTSLPLMSAMVTVLVNQVHFEQAAHLAAKSAQMHPGNIEAERVYLRVLVLNGDSAKARPLARKLLALRPHDFDFLYLSGTLENQNGDYAAAREHLTQAVALNPGYYNVHYNLGIAMLALKDFPGARQEFETALKLGAFEPEVRFKYATALRNLGETDLANQQLKLYQQALDLRSSRSHAASKAAQADQEFAAGDLQKAVADYREATQSNPDDAQIAYKLALALDKTGDTEEERTALERAVKVDPDFALAQNQLGYLASQNGDATSAEEHFRQAVRAAPGYTQAWISLAATLGMESRFNEAQEALASALKLEPDNSEALQLRKDLTAAQQHSNN